MLEYFTYKKVKKHRQEKQDKERASGEQAPPPVLSPTDEQFLQRIVSEDEPAPPLPSRPPILESGDPAGNEQQIALRGDGGTQPATDQIPEASRSKGKGKADTTDKKTNRFSFLLRSGTKKDKNSKDPLPVAGQVNPDGTVTPDEAAKERQDITSVLDNLNLSAKNNMAFSLSKESQVLVQKFTLVLKDLVNGVPTAYDDLVKLLDDSQDQLQKQYKTLPSYLQKLIRTLPTKLSSHMAPELLATAAAAEGGSAERSSMKAAAAKAGLRVPSLKDMVMKPGAVVGMLKTIMNFLKLRWPAFLGTNVLLSLGLFVLLFVFWYCHKRGREARLAKEKLEREGRPVDDEDRFEDLDSDDDHDEFRRDGGASSSANPVPAEPAIHRH